MRSRAGNRRPELMLITERERDDGSVRVTTRTRRTEEREAGRGRWKGVRHEQKEQEE